jgi:hypothetical protein
MLYSEPKDKQLSSKYKIKQREEKAAVERSFSFESLTATKIVRGKWLSLAVSSPCPCSVLTFVFFYLPISLPHFLSQRSLPSASLTTCTYPTVIALGLCWAKVNFREN